MPGKQPFAADNLLHIGFEHRITAVKFLIKAIADARIGGEALHQLGGGFSHQILIRALVGSYRGFSDAVTG